MLPQPQSGEKVSGMKSEASPPASSREPGQSRDPAEAAGAGTTPAAMRSRLSMPMSLQQAMTVSAAIGALMRKIHRQLAWATIRPPSTGPAVKPTYTEVRFRPRARPRSPGGNAAVTIPEAVANMNAPPTP
ncbi:MAG: hypothetical protein A2133_10095 [Actinobacteria bacterium RBG_16_64_13]|nr:MAG: hypothetical protein A2133_10095 [Actinobacteria bacterium RBG_16_64_13]